MKKTYLVKGDHWHENFDCYGVFNEAGSSELAILSISLAASEGSGWVKSVSLSEWAADAELQSLTLKFGPGGDFSLELTKQDGSVSINLEEEVIRLSQDQFNRLIRAWEQIVSEEPVVIEFMELGGVYTLISSKGKQLTVE